MCRLHAREFPVASRRVGIVPPPPMLTLGDMTTTQTPLPGPEAALIGLAALAVVMAQILWPLADHLNVMAHEGTHAITGSIVGFGIEGIEINPNADGQTSYRRPTLGPRRVVSSFVGYLGPSAFGLGAAKLTFGGSPRESRDHEEVAMSDSYRLGWPPGPHPDASGPEAGRCARCGHRADSHLHPGSCSVRGGWWRRCRCSGYTRSDSSTPLTPGPRSPVGR